MNINPVAWFEIYVDDIDRATKFYETVLDQKLTKLSKPEDDYELMAFPMEMDGSGAAGALCQMDGYSAGGNSVLVYFSCQDCAVEASRVEAAGGKLLKPKFAIAEWGFIALATDSEGNTFGLHSVA